MINGKFLREIYLKPEKFEINTMKNLICVLIHTKTAFYFKINIPHPSVTK